MTPRPYQKALLQTAKANHFCGGRHLIQIATGGGKTMVLIDFARWCARLGERVLIVTKDWTLLGQAARDLTSRHSDGMSLCSFVGGTPQARRAFHPRIPNTVDGKIVFTTIQTWNARKNWPEFDAVVIDELHWGEGAPLYTKLLRKYPDAHFIGFTATPRSWTSFRRIGRAYTFDMLVDQEVLAKPILETPVRTGVRWDAQRNGRFGDITQRSLSALAASDERNRLIVQQYVNGARKYGKTLVFACNIAHAERLGRLFSQAGVRAGFYHSKLPAADQESTLDHFRENRLDVLVNVAMLTHGIDIPDIRTIFLARPTLSDILFSQMIGRGSRRIHGKETFRVVDFVDVCTSYGLPIIRPSGFFGTRYGVITETIVREKHHFEDVEFVVMPRTEGYEMIEGLDIHPEQTFGVELELARKDGTTPESCGEFARPFLSAISEVAPAATTLSYRTNPDYTHWNVMHDASCGIEIVSRILQGQAGFLEVMNVTRKLREVAEAEGWCVNAKTGAHVHLAWKADEKRLRRLLKIAAYYEPALYSIVAPSRIGNTYCDSLRKQVDKIHPLTTLRNSTVNVSNFVFDKEPTVEIRLHNGTLNGPKILTWISLWMRILDRALRNGSPTLEFTETNGTPFTPTDEADVASLANFVNAGPTLKRRLLLRREDMVDMHWRPQIHGDILSRWTEGLCEALRESLDSPSRPIQT